MSMPSIKNLVKAAEDHHRQYCARHLQQLIQYAMTVLSPSQSAIVHDYFHTVVLLDHPHDRNVMSPSDSICATLGNDYVYNYVANETQQIAQMIYSK